MALTAASHCHSVCNAEFFVKILDENDEQRVVGASERHAANETEQNDHIVDGWHDRACCIHDTEHGGTDHDHRPHAKLTSQAR